MSFKLPEGVRPYIERAPLAALFLGVSSGFTFAMIGATLTTRLAGRAKSASIFRDRWFSDHAPLTMDYEL